MTVVRNKFWWSKYAACETCQAPQGTPCTDQRVKYGEIKPKTVPHVGRKRIKK